MSKEAIFAIYKGDKFVDLGTKKELAIRRGCKPEWIKHLATPAYKRKLAKRKNKGKNALIALRIDDK